jgi:hypothetical protein
MSACRSRPEAPPVAESPDPSDYDPTVHEILYGPTIAKVVECPAYNQPLNLPLPAPEDEPEDHPPIAYPVPNLPISMPACRSRPEAPPVAEPPDPSDYDPTVYEILYGPPIIMGVECPAYYQPLNLPLPAPEDELEDELSRLDSVTGSGQGGQQQQQQQTEPKVKPNVQEREKGRGRCLVGSECLKARWGRGLIQRYNKLRATSRERRRSN